MRYRRDAEVNALTIRMLLNCTFVCRGVIGGYVSLSGLCLAVLLFKGHWDRWMGSGRGRTDHVGGLTFGLNDHDAQAFCTTIGDGEHRTAEPRGAAPKDGHSLTSLFGSCAITNCARNRFSANRSVLRKSQWDQCGKNGTRLPK